MDKLDLTGSHLTLKAKTPNINHDKFIGCAEEAKANCPVSKALSLEITLDAPLNRKISNSMPDVTFKFFFTERR